MQGSRLVNTTIVNSPGKLKIVYCNARSVLPKLDELAATCGACDPDIVCIVESWLCSEIGDEEIFLPNYSAVRLDRNRHGGGILMFIKSTLLYDIVLPGSAGLELIFPCILLPCNRKVCLGIFYEPPSASAAIFDTLSDVLCSLNSSLFSNLVLLGDFNVNMTLLSSSPFCNHLTNLQNSFLLTQVVEEHTRPGRAGQTPSLIDLVFMSAPHADTLQVYHYTSIVKL